MVLPKVYGAITVTASRGLVEPSGAAEPMVETRDREGFGAGPLATLGNAFEGSPGILVQQTSPSQVSPFLRGLTGYHVLNLVDGIRFNNTTFRSGPNQYLALIDPSQVQRLESALGPSSSQYGSDSLGGTIQVVTREAGFATSDRLQIHGEWNGFGATADASARTGGHLSIGNARLATVLGLSGRKHNDLRAGDGSDSRHVLRRMFGLSSSQIGDLTGDRQQDTGFTQWGADAKLAARLSANQLLSLWYQRSAQGDSRNYKDLWGGLGRMQSSLDPQALHFAYLRYERIGLGWLDTVGGTFSANVQDDGSRRQALRSQDSVTTDDSQVKVFGYTFQATTHVRRRQAIVFGGELYQERVASSRSILNPTTAVSISSRPLYPDQSRYRTAALFVQDRLEFGSRWRATLGGRWTQIRYATGRDAFGTAASRQEFGDWTFNTALAYRVSNALSVHGLIGRGFRAPNANDLGAIGLNDLGYEIPAADAVPSGALLGSSSGEGATSLGRAVAGLKPERLLNHELGLRLQHRRVQSRLQAFDAEFFDPIVRRTLLFTRGQIPATLSGLPVTPLVPTAAQQAQGVLAVATAFDPRAVKAFVNDGRSRYYGVEASARLSLDSHWTAEASYSYILGRDLDPNRNVRRLPPQQGMVAVGRTATRFWWQTSLLFAGPQNRLSGGDIDDERIGASRSRADIAAFFQGDRVAPFIRQGLFTPTAETLRQIQDRVLPGVADGVRAPLYSDTAGWLTWNVVGGIPLSDQASVHGGVSNILDRNYRVHGSGADAPGVSAFLGFRVRF